MLRPFILLTSSAVACLTAACADSIDSKTPDAGTPSTGRVQTTRGADGTYTTLVDATSATEWVHADLETGGEVASTTTWDLRFQRFHISTNSGPTGTGTVEVAALAGTTFAAVTAAPPSGFVRDAADGNGAPAYAFEQGDGWYAYDSNTHLLSPRPLVWVVRTDRSTLKLEISRYYDAAGTAGWFTLHWGPL